MHLEINLENPSCKESILTIAQEYITANRLPIGSIVSIYSCFEIALVQEPHEFEHLREVAQSQVQRQEVLCKYFSYAQEGFLEGVLCFYEGPETEVHI
jgi:hypothetical protein